MSKLDKFLIVVIIINLFASIFIIFGKDRSQEVKMFEIANFDEFIDKYRAGPSPERYRNFVKSLVENKFNDLYEATKNLSEAELKNFYNKESQKAELATLSNMQNIYGISDYSEFSKLIEKLRTINEKNAKYKSCKIIKKSCVSGAEYTSSELQISYSKSQKLKLKIEIANMIDAETQVFKVSVKEDK